MKIYFVHQGLQSFVKKDLEILKECHEVRQINNFSSTIEKIPRNLMGVIWCDLVFCWFCSLKSIIPIVCGRLLGKKVVIVAGGYDVVNLPQIKYGSMQGGWDSWMHKQLFRLAHRVICISRSNMVEAINNAGISRQKITMIYHGFKKQEHKQRKKEKIVITAGIVSEENLFRKGLGLFIEAAKYFPQVPFVIIGSLDDGLQEKIDGIAPLNLSLTGYVSNRKLEEYFMRAKVYVQASMHEGFGCSVAEAMLHECIPVVSDCFALPEVTGDAGYLFKPGNLEGLKGKIFMALEDDSEMGKRARLRVENEFSLEARRESLFKLIDSL